MKALRLDVPIARLLAPCAAACAIVGCGSPAAHIKPAGVGPLGESPIRGPLRVELWSDSTSVRRGEPLRICGRAVNVSTEPVTLPERPILLLSWTYPGGLRDNTIRPVPESQFFQPAEVVTLPPGGNLFFETTVATRYFWRGGVVVFRGILHVPRNQNPAIPGMPAGRFASNAIGVLVAE